MQTGTDTWWTIHGTSFMDALQRAHNGELPDLVYAEFYANSEPTVSAGDDDAD